MAITISGENNNDRILASDGVIDEISGINIVGLLTASHLDVGNNIQLGNAGIITATTFIGNLTGNVNSTSPLLLQTDGGERFRITGNNELGIAGANYGSAGQVLTSGGSGNAVSWTTIAAQANISNNADNRIITGGSGVNLNGEANLTFDGGTLALNGRYQRGSATVQDGDAIAGGININGLDMDSSVIMSVFGNDNDFTRISGSKSRNASVGNHTIVQDNDVLLSLKGFGSDGTNFEEAAQIEMQVDGTPNNNVMPGRIVFKTTTTDGVVERLRITADGDVLFSGLTSKNDPRNAKGISLKSTSGISFQNYGANGSYNWRIRPDDLINWGTLEFSVSPTSNSATDWPDAATDVALTLQPNKDVIVNKRIIGI